MPQGIVDSIYINRLEQGMIQDEPKSDIHKVRSSWLQAKVRSEKGFVAVDFDNTDVLNHYGKKYIAEGLRTQLQNDLSGKTIEYDNYDGGVYHLVGSISKYV